MDVGLALLATPKRRRQTMRPLALAAVVPRALRGGARPGIDGRESAVAVARAVVLGA
jgi:hypothetical protein